MRTWWIFLRGGLDKIYTSRCSSYEFTNCLITVLSLSPTKIPMRSRPIHLLNSFFQFYRRQVSIKITFFRIGAPNVDKGNRTCDETFADDGFRGIRVLFCRHSARSIWYGRIFVHLLSKVQTNAIVWSVFPIPLTKNQHTRQIGRQQLQALLHFVSKNAALTLSVFMLNFTATK